jgi:hypothetical protein
MKAGLKVGAVTFYVLGELTYFDAFQDMASVQPRRTSYRFTMKIEGEGVAGFVLADEGNESD